MSELLWSDEKISSEASEATDELDGSMYVRHVISQLLVKMRVDYEAALANQYQRIERFVELVNKLERKLQEATEANASCARYIADQIERIGELEAERDMPDEIMDTIRRSLISSESLNSTDDWYKRMTTALAWLDRE